MVSAYGLGQRFGRLGGHLPLVRRIQVEIDAAERTRTFALAQNHRDLTVQGNSVPQVRATGLEGLDGLSEQGEQCFLKVIGGFVDAYDIFPVRLYCVFQFWPESLSGHSQSIGAVPGKREAKIGGKCMQEG